MNGPSPAGAMGAAAVFAALAALASPAGMPRDDQAAWERRAGVLREAEKVLNAEATLHHPLSPTVFPEPSSFCETCHPLPPHEGEGAAPAFLNHHAVSLDCLVCHWAGIAGRQPDPSWDLRETPPGQAGPEVREKLILRLVEPLEGAKRDVALLREEVTRSQKCFDRGPDCVGCHRRGGMGRYAKPGLSPEAESSLERLPDFLILSRGAKWYFPAGGQ